VSTWGCEEHTFNSKHA